MSDFESFVERHRRWSFDTFGSGRQTLGLTRHIETELAEIRANPEDLSEWIDVIMLALDGYLRHGGAAENLMHDLRAKQDINFARSWPAATDEDTPAEHDRSGENR